MLERTLGVPIFQEQVMQLAMVAAGFTPGEADELRRAMAAWRRKGGLEPFERRLTRRACSRTGYTRRIRRAHLPPDPAASASTAFPSRTRRASRCSSTSRRGSSTTTRRRSCAALLNSQPMGFYSPSRARAGRAPPRRRGAAGRCHREQLGLHARAQLGVPAVRLGLRMVKGLSEAGAQRRSSSRA